MTIDGSYGGEREREKSGEKEVVLILRKAKQKRESVQVEQVCVDVL